MSYTASSINAGLACPRLYKWKYVDGWNSIPSSAMSVGTLVHKGLEAYWLGKKLSNALQDMWNSTAESDWWQSEEGLIAYAKCGAYIKGYYEKYWGKDPLNTFSGHVTVWTEREFEFTYADVTFKGKFDVLIIDHENKTAHVIEHKTTSLSLEIGGVYFDRLPMDVQCTIYRQAALEILMDPSTPSLTNDYPELPVVTYDVIGTNRGAPKQKTKSEGGKKVSRLKDETDAELAKRKEDNQETIQEFEQRMTRLYKDPQIPKYVRHEVACTMLGHTDRLTELVKYTSLLANRGFLEIRNSTSCGNYGGCAFVDTCLGRAQPADSTRLVQKLDVHEELSGEVGNYVEYT